MSKRIKTPFIQNLKDNDNTIQSQINNKLTNYYPNIII